MTLLRDKPTAKVRDRFLPVEPALSPGMLLPGGRPSSWGFPFTGRHRWYYFGRNAVWHGVKLLGLGEGDEVLMPAYNEGVEVAAVLDAGPSIRFFPIGSRLEIDLDDLRARISPKTKALFVIHYLGFPQPLEEMKAICREHGLWLIEDCAHALLSSADGQPLGRDGAFSIFCIYKTIPVPHGGLLVLNDPSLGLPEEAQPPGLLSSLRGLPHHLFDYLEIRQPALGRWFRVGVRHPTRALLRRAPVGRTHIVDDKFERALVGLGASKLVRRLSARADTEAIVKTRRRNFEALMDLLPKSRQVIHTLPEGVCPLFFPVLVADKPSAMRILAGKGIESIPFWSKAHPAIPAGAFPAVEYLRAHVLEVPIHQTLQPEDMTYLAQALADVPAPVADHGRLNR